GGSDEPCPAALAHRDGPCEEEQGFDIEDHEEHRDQIEFGGEAQPGVTGRNDARFEGLVLAAPPGAAAQYAGHQKHEGAKTQNTQQLGSQRPAMWQFRYSNFRHTVTPWRTVL